MTQDIKRWCNQRFAVSVYQIGTSPKNCQYIIESINVENPQQVIRIEQQDLRGLQGRLLMEYIDDEFRIKAKEGDIEEEGDDQYGFNDEFD
jgi:hypothetical protein